MSEKTSGFQSSHPPPTLSFAETSYAAALRLLSLVDAEFEALKKQDLTGFEALQPEKLQLLEQLGEVAKKIEQGKLGDQGQPEWLDFKALVLRCRDGHRRNETLISRQLLTIRGALQALSGTSGPDSVEMYDRLGQLTPHARRDRYNEA
jgi:flagellar biosynthesis/type III secretory pathway chaperone